MPICLPSFAGTTTPASGAAFTNQNSVSFDGTDDSIAISSTPTYITQSSAFSLSFWMNPSGYGSHGTYANVLALKSDFNSKNFAIHINNNTSGYAGISFGITDYGTNTAFYHTTGVTGNTLLNTWSHVVITYDGSGLGTIGNWKLYINGSSKTIGTGGGWFDSGTPINTIGNYRSYHYEGLIDELAVFNSELSSSNVTSIYNSGAPTDISSFSPVGWWRMGDGTEAGSGTTIYDMSSNSNNGTLTNGPTFSTSVPEYVFNQYSVDFDGTNDYMAAGNITALNSVANASYSFWYKTSATGKVGLLGGGAGTSAYHWSDGNMYVHSFVNTLSHPITIPTLGAWHHVVCTFEASGSKLYLDGSLQSTVDHGDTTASNAGNGFQVGRVPHYSIPDGQKLIDEVALFTSTLSASDVSAIYNSGVPADLTSYSPVNWWRMGDNDSGTGTTITDQGSGSNDGTLTNGPTFSTTVPT